jgi:TetR/AcrR family transcriptional regulator
MDMAARERPKRKKVSRPTLANELTSLRPVRLAARPKLKDAVVVDESMSLKERRREQRQQLNRTQILEAAEVVFAAKGLHAATMREIASLAGFSIGAVYSMFESRDEILLKLLSWRGEQFTEGTHAVLTPPRSVREQLHALAEYQIEFFRTHRHFGRLWIRTPLVTLEELGSTLRRDGGPSEVEALRLQRDLFARGQVTGEVRDGDPSVLAMLFSGLVHAYQSTDALLLDDEPENERLALTKFHEILDGAFIVGTRNTH